MTTYPDDCRYAVIDCETTGLDRDGNYILEVSWLFIDAWFRQVSQPQSYMVKLPPGHYEDAIADIEANGFVKKMHIDSGLYDDLEDDSVEKIPMHEILDIFVEDALANGADRMPFKFAGYSVSFDREFLRVNGWFDLIESNRLGFQMHHRILDISSILQFFEGSHLDIPYIENENAHRALNDVVHSMQTLQALSRSVQPVGA
ncbi:exonuclease [Microbacterium phage Zooman]|nr:exonuclease [Microbacterium phage Zooman]